MNLHEIIHHAIQYLMLFGPVSYFCTMKKAFHLHLYRFLLVLVSVLTPFLNFGQNSGHRISFDLSGQNDSSYILVRHYGNKIHLVDSATKNSAGLVTFEGNEHLPGGVYVLANKKRNKLIEFIVSNNQHFSIEADFSGDDFRINAPDDDVNSMFFKQISISNSANKELSAWKTKLEAGLINEDRYAKISDSLNHIIKQFRTTVIDSFPDSFISILFRAMKETDIPEEIKGNAEKSYHYFKNHYWDNFLLSDDRLLRSPIFQPKLDFYFKQLVPPVPDSVIHSIDRVISLTGNNEEVRDYLIWHFASEYQNSTIMGMDKVFVHMADNYFSKYSVANTSPSVLEKIKERADQLRLLLIGKTAPDIWLIDTTGNYRSFREIKNEFTVLLFWDHECGVCKKEMDALINIYKSGTIDMEVFAIGTNGKLDGWKDYLIRYRLPWINVNGTRSLNADFHDLYDIYGTPVIYLLDKEKRIIAKRIKAEQISLVIENYRMNNQNPLFR